jgi:hypothetical protein
MTTRDDIKNFIAYFMMAFPNYHPDITSAMNTTDVYYDLLKDIPLEDLKLAVRTACAEPGRAFAPSPGEIRGASVNLHIKVSGVPTAGEAWQEVIATIQHRGCHGEIPEFSNPIIKKAVQAVGFVNIGMSEDVMVERAHFLKIYTQLLDRNTEDAAMLPEAVEYVHKQIEYKQKLLKG